MMQTQQQIDILHHTLGVNPERRESYRNYYVADHGHHAIADLQALESMGLMARARTPAFLNPTDIVFMATESGRALALERLPDPPKLTLYDEYLRQDSCESFGEFLCGWRLPKYETRGHWRDQEYRMYRPDWDGVHGHHRDVQGQWVRTKKEAKASYKAALKAYRAAPGAKP